MAGSISSFPNPPKDMEFIKQSCEEMVYISSQLFCVESVLLEKVNTIKGNINHGGYLWITPWGRV
jgi:hypothetical protein